MSDSSTSALSFPHNSAAGNCRTPWLSNSPLFQWKFSYCRYHKWDTACMPCPAAVFQVFILSPKVLLLFLRTTRTALASQITQETCVFIGQETEYRADRKSSGICQKRIPNLPLLPQFMDTFGGLYKTGLALSLCPSFLPLTCQRTFFYISLQSPKSICLPDILTFGLVHEH